MRALSGKLRAIRKTTRYQENYALSGNARRIEKARSFPETAHHAQPPAHAIVEKLTAVRRQPNEGRTACANWRHVAAAAAFRVVRSS
jgi:hypothetical protein